MFDIVLKKFKEELEKDYPDYAFYITDDLEAEDFVINSVICEINGITVKNAKEYSAMLNFYIIKPKVQDDLGNFILQALDIQKKIQNLDENKRIFFSEKMNLQFGELRAKEKKETLRVCLITGVFDTSFPIKYVIDNKEKYKPVEHIYLNNGK